MTSKTRSFRPSPALVIACIALFAALTGSAIAAGVGKNTVRSPQIVDGTIRTIDLRDNSVAAGKIAPKAVDQVLHLAYRVFPESTAAKGKSGADGADGGADKGASNEALMIAHLLKGVHW